MSLADELEKLSKLRENGAITEEEFIAAKRQIMPGERAKSKSTIAPILGRFSAWYFAASLLGTLILTFQAGSTAGTIVAFLSACMFVLIGLGKIDSLRPEKWGKITLLGLTLIFVTLLISLNDRQNHKSTSNWKNSENASTNHRSANNSQEGLPDASEKTIPGIMPVDVYLALEKEGFSTAKELSPCCTWYSSLGGNSPIIMTAETHGNSPSSVYRINARVVTTIDKNTKEVAKPFMGFLATLQYSGSQPELAREWVETNIGMRTSKRFGSALITLDHGADNALMMSITPD